MRAINPATGALIAEYEDFPAERIPEAVKKADQAHQEWRTLPLAERSKRTLAAATVLRDRSEELAQLMTAEMGKPIKEARSEIEKCAWVCEYYAESAEHFLSPEMVETSASRSYIAYEPLGVILAIMPWNFPIWQVVRFAAPAMTSGNAVLLKHAPSVPGCALACEDIFRKAGFPEGLFQTLLLYVDEVEKLIDDPLVRAVTLTGSTAAGKAVASAAGSRLKKTVLELGGSDPYVILADADLDAAMPACLTARLINTGQSCIAAKRYIVVESLREEFERELVARMTAVRMGDPTSEDVDIGPIARDDLRANLHRQVEESVTAGARLLLGGKLPAGTGFYYPPTVLTDVGPGMPAYLEELFGPVASVIPVANDDEALRAANDTVYGLSGAVFTSDVERGERIAREVIQAGSVFVNEFSRSDPRLPFGGIKESGYGRELSGFGIREFVNVKAVYVK
jgi:succinate-semialdehyde dehydrogenase/glutarate-semialdehyde dehydrogenase